MEEGSGTTRDFSAGGVFFHADRPLPPEGEVELNMDWPVKIRGGSSLTVMISGRIVRSTARGVAIQISHSEFQMSSTAAAD